MSRRKHTTFERGRRKAVVLWDAEWQEWSIKYYVCNEYMPEADSFHGDDKDDAMSSARWWTDVEDPERDMELLWRAIKGSPTLTFLAEQKKAAQS